jgi:hypothetical protein
MTDLVVVFLGSGSCSSFSGSFVRSGREAFSSGDPTALNSTSVQRSGGGGVRWRMSISIVREDCLICDIAQNEDGERARRSHPDFLTAWVSASWVGFRMGQVNSAEIATWSVKTVFEKAVEKGGYDKRLQCSPLISCRRYLYTSVKSTCMM